MDLFWDLIIGGACVVLVFLVATILFGRDHEKKGSDDPVGDFIEKAADKFGGSK